MTDRKANHQLMLACRRLDTALASRDQRRGEAARAEVVSAMAVLVEEFGLGTQAESLRLSLPEFDGRHIEEGD